MSENIKETLPLTNRQFAKPLETFAQLMEIKGENRFKYQSYQKAADNIKASSVIISECIAQNKKIEIEGVGKSILESLIMIAQTGTFPALEMIKEEVPTGLLSFSKIEGLGPKKRDVLWKEMQITDIGALLSAAKSKKLSTHKAFSAKFEAEIIDSIEQFMRWRSMSLLANAEILADTLSPLLKTQFNAQNILPAAELRRFEPLMESVCLLVVCEEANIPKEEFDFQEAHFQKSESNYSDEVSYEGALSDFKKIKLYFTSPPNMGYHLFKSTTPADFYCDKFESITLSAFKDLTEQAIFDSVGLPFLPPEVREIENEALFNQEKYLQIIPKLIQANGIKGVLHSHTTYSDGVHSLIAMAEACQKFGYSYYGVTDHSKTAAYANGLQHERIIKQHQEIDLLNAKNVDFKIFKGIESDILGDGSLDYDKDILASFDFIVASVHSGLNMTEEKATQRIIEAIKNPYTSILGHSTGRLLAKRHGYPIDYQYIIDICAQTQTAIELNCNPYRMDMDWRWLGYAVSQGVMIAINPDAHSIEQINFILQGVKVGRKALLLPENVLNCLSAEDFSKWLKNQRLHKLSLQNSEPSK